MTKEQIEQQAEEYANTTYTHSKEAVKQAYIAGAESRQPEIDEARKIIKGLLHLLHIECYRTRYYEEMQRAEQFLGDEK